MTGKKTFVHKRLKYYFVYFRLECKSTSLWDIKTTVGDYFSITEQ